MIYDEDKFQAEIDVLNKRIAEGVTQEELVDEEYEKQNSRAIQAFMAMFPGADIVTALHFIDAIASLGLLKSTIATNLAEKSRGW
jgi:hypothetical protein